MGFFEKAKEDTKSCACTCGNCGAEAVAAAEAARARGARVKILGSGCAKCNALEAATLEALGELGMEAQVEHVKDFKQIAAYGVMTTPALMVDGKVVSLGRVLKKDEIMELLLKAKDRFPDAEK